MGGVQYAAINLRFQHASAFSCSHCCCWQDAVRRHVVPHAKYENTLLSFCILTESAEIDTDIYYILGL